jgi:flavodoxin
VAAAKESDRVLPEHHTLDRSSLIRGTLLGATGLFVGGGLSNWSGQARAETERDEHDRTPANRILLVYFSRAGENYYYGGRRDLKIGNTEVLAGMISKQIRVDVHRIRAAQPYPHSYQRTVSRNVREQNADARPRIANPLTSIERYDVVLLGSPIWNVRPPMIMSTFTDSHDFDRKTIYPFVTYAVSGLGTTAEVYTASCPNATIGEGLAVRGERVRGADRAVESWLRRINLLR